MTGEQLERFLRNAPPGQVEVYHTGLLMKDRQEDEELDLLADRLWWEAKQGRVQLVQRRLAGTDGLTIGPCEYRVVKSKAVGGGRRG